ncbi:FRG domain-containing protein [Neptuniibacter sp. QD48_55]|uniref:FRG domain-containing protein n=1 Tax=Neptuniibacter sp. QD48_55 TaxID=3398212 RepID=UPI0039F4C9F8
MEALQEEYQERKEIYFKNLPLWPDFDIYDQNIDGLMPSAYLETWEQFHDVVKNYRVDEDGVEYVFRGQHNYEWELQPTLDRMSPGAIQEDIARKQLRNFRLSIRGRVDNAVLSESDDEELWAIGQHHGLATPLLDWSLAPYVSLFFAFVNEDPPSWVDNKGNPTNYSRVIYILNKTFIEDLVETDESCPLEEGYPKIVEPSKDDHGRLVNQAGLFTIAPYGETLESALLKALVDSDVDVDNPEEVSKYICKLHLPNSAEFRRDCLRHLRKMNIHHASLFPDVIGASGYCNELINEAIEGKNKPKPSSQNAVPNLDEKAEINSESVSWVPGSNVVEPTFMNALVVNEKVQLSVSESILQHVVALAIDFVETKSGVDWFKRDSQKARLRNIIRRELKRVNFPDDLVAEAAQSLIDALAKTQNDKDE